MANDLLTNFNAANSLRNLAKQYEKSSDPHTEKQYRLLNDMANDIINRLYDHAAFRYNNLHVNVRSQISFEVLDLLGMAEKHDDELSQ